MSVKRTFLTFRNLSDDETESIYEIAIGLSNRKYMVTVTEDVVENNIPQKSRKSVPPYSSREEDTLEKALIYYNAYIAELQRTQPLKGWVLTEQVEKSL